MEKLKVKVESIERFREHNFFMKTKPEKELKFKAGQFVMVGLGEIEKPFSIASFLGEKTLDFLISVHPDGEMTPKLEGMKKGDGFVVGGPYGVFGVKDTNAKEIVFVAAGTGVAPFRSMVVDALQRFHDKKIKLIFGFRYDYYFEKFWKELGKKYKNFEVCATCSKPGKGWKGKSGRVTEHFDCEIKDSKAKEVYICGPPAMVQSTKEELARLGFNNKQIHMEKW
ncbi:MAG: FAD-binding oxidoreductase [archaeon]